MHCFQFLIKFSNKIKQSPLLLPPSNKCIKETLNCEFTEKSCGHIEKTQYVQFFLGLSAEQTEEVVVHALGPRDILTNPPPVAPPRYTPERLCSSPPCLLMPPTPLEPPEE